MITTQDIEKLADLARINITDEEKEQLGKEIDAILNYVTQIKNAPISFDPKESVGPVRNVIREDAHPHESGSNTEKILNEAPQRQGDYIKVKKIL